MSALQLAGDDITAQGLKKSTSSHTRNRLKRRPRKQDVYSFFSDKYTDGRILGYGVYGRTFVAKRDGKSFCIKEFNMELVPASFVSPCINSFSRFSLIRHKNIVNYLECFLENNILFVVSNYLPCGSLSEYFVRNGLLSIEESAFVVEEVIEGLKYLHSFGVLHLNLHPGNVFLKSDGRVKIGDVHLLNNVPHRIHSYHFESESVGGLCAGVPPIMPYVGKAVGVPPELLQQREATEYTDSWFVGALLLEMLTGNAPFANLPFPQSVYEATIRQPELPINFSESLCNFLDKCFKIVPRQRVSCEEAQKLDWLVKTKHTRLHVKVPHTPRISESTISPQLVVLPCAERWSDVSSAIERIDNAVATTSEITQLVHQCDQTLSDEGYSALQELVKRTQDLSQHSEALGFITKALNEVPLLQENAKTDVMKSGESYANLKKLLITNIRKLTEHFVINIGSDKLASLIYGKHLDKLEYICEGNLSLMSSEKNSGIRWKERYFLLKDNFLFMQKKQKITKVFYLNILDVQEMNSATTKRDFCFNVDKFVFCAPNQSAFHNWTTSLRKSSRWFEVQTDEIATATMLAYTASKTLASSKGTSNLNPSSSTLSLSSSHNVNPMFGYTLVQIAQREGSTTPAIVERITAFLLEKGLNEVGIFRVNGDSQMMKRLQEEFETDTPDLNSFDFSTICSVLKLFFRRLPEPLIPSEIDAKFRHFTSLDKKEVLKHRQEIKLVLSELHTVHYQTLKRILYLFTQIIDRNKVNKMTLDNLVTCFVPSLSCLPSTFSFLITNYDILFQ